MTETIEGFDDGEIERLLDVRHKINETLEELSTPDWISVEDELPKLGEDVLVCNKENPGDMWFCHRTSPKDSVTDKHGFASRMAWEEITHWRRIEKLEE